MYSSSFLKISHVLTLLWSWSRLYLVAHPILGSLPLHTHAVGIPRILYPSVEAIFASSISLLMDPLRSI